VRKTASLPVGASAKKTSSRKNDLGAPVKKTSSLPLGGAHGGGGGAKTSSLMRKLPPPSADFEPEPPSSPPAQKAGRAAEKVRALATEKIDASWRDLKAEFEVQKMVWESLSLQKKVDAKKTSNLQTTLEGAMAARVKHPSVALRTMQQLNQEQGGSQGSELLNNGMIKAIRNVVDQAEMIHDRSRLAERLSTAGIPATLPVRPAEKEEMEALVVACKLENGKLERTARELLLLPVPAGLGAPQAAGPKSSGMPVSQKSSGMSATQKKTSSRPHSTAGIDASAQNKPIAGHTILEIPFEPPQRRMLEL